VLADLERAARPVSRKSSRSARSTGSSARPFFHYLLSAFSYRSAAGGSYDDAATGRGLAGYGPRVVLRACTVSVARARSSRSSGAERWGKSPRRFLLLPAPRWPRCLKGEQGPAAQLCCSVRLMASTRGARACRGPRAPDRAVVPQNLRHALPVHHRCGGRWAGANARLGPSEAHRQNAAAWIGPIADLDQSSISPCAPQRFGCRESNGTPAVLRL